MARIDTLTNFLTDIASAIKTRKGDTSNISASDFDNEILNLPYTNETIKNILDKTITNLTLPEDITEIGDYVFFNCTNLTMDHLPSNLTTIGNSSFKNCQSLQITEIPASVQTIGNEAFSFAFQTDPLDALTFKGTPTSIAEDAFKEVVIGTINVPWAEGEVSGGDTNWGAVYSTINYNYQETL